MRVCVYLLKHFAATHQMRNQNCNLEKNINRSLMIFITNAFISLCRKF